MFKIIINLKIVFCTIIEAYWRVCSLFIKWSLQLDNMIALNREDNNAFYLLRERMTYLLSIKWRYLCC